MNLFQFLALGVLLALTTATLAGAARGNIRKRIAVFWVCVWIASGIAVAWPESTAIAARVLGIGRGADLVLYCTVVATLAGFFYVYTRFRRLDRQITQLVRQLAIENPVRPASGPEHEPQVSAE